MDQFSLFVVLAGGNRGRRGFYSATKTKIANGVIELINSEFSSVK